MEGFRPVKERITNGMCALGGIGLGAGLMYLFDPDRGKRRRATLRDKATVALHEAGDTVDKGMRDLTNRVSGEFFEAVNYFSPEQVSDDVLASRIRTALGRTVSYPHAIEVSVTQGAVVLTGHILQRDVERLLLTVGRMKGVHTIDNKLREHLAPGDVPDMRGRPHDVRDRMLLDRQWTPAARLGAAVAGSFLTIYGLSRRGIFGFACKAAGTAMFLRALKKPLQHSFGAHDELGRGVDMQKTITVDSPVQTVFEMLADPVNFPKFMTHVHEVKKLDDKLYRWTVVGPAGALAHWDAQIVRLVANELLEWKTSPESTVQHAGVVRVDPTAYGGSRVHVRLSFCPPGGTVGKALAEFFGMYPKHMLDEDLARFKSLMEHGKTRAHHHAVMLHDVAAAE